MFICQECNQCSKDGEKQFKKSTKLRKQLYKNTYLDDRGKIAKDSEGNILYKVTQGTEIVKEINVCCTCQ